TWIEAIFAISVVGPLSCSRPLASVSTYLMTTPTTATHTRPIPKDPAPSSALTRSPAPTLVAASASPGPKSATFCHNPVRTAATLPPASTSAGGRAMVSTVRTLDRQADWIVARGHRSINQREPVASDHGLWKIYKT